MWPSMGYAAHLNHDGALPLNGPVDAGFGKDMRDGPATSRGRAPVVVRCRSLDEEAPCRDGR